MIPPVCKGNRRDISPGQAAALYVHVPFCRSKCRYCDFYSRPADAALAGQYVRAARAELASRADRLRAPLASIYVGGGTPTALGPAELGELLSAAAPFADARTEFTVETNPGTVDPAVAEVLAAAGVNRVAMGAQSFLARELAVLGRTHRPADVGAALARLRAAGLENVGLDLIYGIPGQGLRTWRASLTAALDLGVRHLSCYALSFEPGTPLQADLAAGRVAEMDESLQRACYDAAIDAAARAGLGHYEVSNFAAAGSRCRHNLTYWRNEPYLGIGPAAASFLDGARSTNAADLEGYLEAWRRGQPPPARQERLTGRAAMAEALMLGLRLTEGVERGEFAARYGQDPVAAFPGSLRRYEQMGAVEVTPDRVRIATGAMFVSDAILAEVLAEA